MPSKRPELRVEHELLKKSGKIRSRWFSQDGYEHYNIRLKLRGDTSDVERVEYELHPTFKRPRRVVTDPSNGFALDIWTWGEFLVHVTVHMRDGTEQVIDYDLSYSSELPAEDDAYTAEGPR